MLHTSFIGEASRVGTREIPSRTSLNPKTLKTPSPRAIAERHLSKSFKTLSANPLNFQGAIASYKGPRDGFQDFELQARIPKIPHRPTEIQIRQGFLKMA